MKKFIKLLFVLAIFCSIVSYDSFAKAVPENSNFTLQVKDKLINLQAENADFKEILKDLDAKTGIKVKIYEGVKDKKVSLNIKSLPLYALDTIIKKMTLKNSAVVYDDALQMMSVYVLPEGLDISKVVSGGTVIRSADFAVGKEVLTIKGKEFVTIEKGKNKLPIRYVKDELLIKFHLGITEKEIDSILQEYGLQRIPNVTLSKIGYVKVKVLKDKDVIETAKAIRKDYRAKVPEPNYIAGILTANDPLYDKQWYIPDTGFDKAWPLLKKKSVVKVAVIDTGVDSLHPDLNEKIFQGKDFVNNDADPADDNGHGTFISGIIAANANDIGIKGLYDGARILPVKVIDANGLGTYEDVANGIVYAVDQGASLINMSIGGYAYSFMLQDAVDYALVGMGIPGASLLKPKRQEENQISIVSS